MLEEALGDARNKSGQLGWRGCWHRPRIRGLLEIRAPLDQLTQSGTKTQVWYGDHLERGWIRIGCGRDDDDIMTTGCKLRGQGVRPDYSWAAVWGEEMRHDDDTHKYSVSCWVK